MKPLSIHQARVASIRAVYDCRALGIDSSKWEQIFADVCGEGINGMKVHL